MDDLDRVLLERVLRGDWMEPLTQWVSALPFDSHNHLLASYEELSGWPGGPFSESPIPPVWPIHLNGFASRGEKHPVTTFVSCVGDLLGDNVEIRTIVVLRNQADWLSSLAAEVGLPSGWNLDTVLAAAADRHEPFLNYFKLIQDLEETVGPQRNMTLFFEDGADHNLQEIMRFAEVGVAPHAVPQENVRSSSAGQWHVRGRLKIENTEMLIKWRRVIGPPPERIRKMLRPYLNLVNRLGALLFPQKDRIIGPSQEVRNILNEHVRMNNKLLADHLGRDLRALGYSL